MKTFAEPLYKLRTWLRLVGILTVVAGVLTALTIAGVVVAWIPIWAGIALYQSASNIEEALFDAKTDAFIRALSKLGLYFKMNAVILLLGLALVPIIVAVVVIIPPFLRYEEPNNEARAIADIQSINLAQAKYMISSQRYGTLRNLVDASLVDRRLLNPRPGYRLQIETEEGNYVVLASALATGGHYDYYSFADGVIRYSSDPGRAPSGLSAAPVH